MEETDNSYIYFPRIMMIFLILTLMFGYAPDPDLSSYDEYYSIFDALEIYSISVIKLIFLIVFMVINFIVLIFCYKKGKQSQEIGWDYKINKKMIFVFLLLAILPYLVIALIDHIEEPNFIYYTIFLHFTRVNIFCGIFYFIKIKDKYKKMKSEI